MSPHTAGIGSKTSLRTRLLIVLLRVGGGMMLLALFAVFMPAAWMDATHRWLGLGPMPGGVMFEFLARTTSALYAVLGGLFCVLSIRPRRYRAVLTYLAAAMIFLGVAIGGMGLLFGLPWYWLATDPPTAIGFGVLVLLLQGRRRARGGGDDRGVR
jgi:hypothetical protein